MNGGSKKGIIVVILLLGIIIIKRKVVIKEKRRKPECSINWAWENKIMLIIWLFKWLVPNVFHLNLNLSHENWRVKPFTKQEIDKVHI